MNNRWEKVITRMTLGIVLSLMIFLFPSKVNAMTEGESKSFSYNGGIQSFTVEETGYYQLETWGGQGGSISGYYGGYGGYATGNVLLKKGETIYIVVGGQGAGATGQGQSLAGGYNGGGNVTGNGGVNHITGAGGGATHIAKKTGLLSTLSKDRESILIVAGGGGGARNQANHIAAARWGYGGSGGGYIAGGAVSNYGSTSSFTTVTLGSGTQTSGYAFGQGGSATGNSAGGGGYYGGSSGIASTRTNIGPGSGGSGYIGNPKLFSYEDKQKVMYCYNCPTSTEEDTYTQVTTGYSTTPTAFSAKLGSGAAKITFLKAVSDESRLKSLTVSSGKLEGEFDPDIYEYTLTVDSEDFNIDVDATAMDDKAVVAGVGNYNIQSGTSDHSITVTAEDGEISTYVLHITRAPSSYKYLSMIKVNEEEITSFNPKILEYTVNLPYDQEEISLDAIFGRPLQMIDGTGKFKISTGTTTKKIEVTSEDKKSTITYTIHFIREHSSKLKSLTIDGYEIEPEFNKEVYEYTVSIMNSTLSLDVDAVAYDEEAVVTLNGFGYIKSSADAMITVKEPNSKDTIYKIKIIKEAITTEKIYEFPCTGTIQTFTAEENGYYRLEVWGGQGGSIPGYYGGYGGYATGNVLLKKGETIYIVVGGQGAGAISPGQSLVGGYNGGGSVTGNSRVNHITGAGGGATHIATKTGLLSTLSKDRESILIVAGGGGGARNQANHVSAARWGNGGSGGGYIAGGAVSNYGSTSSFTTVTLGSGTQTSGYAFGQGGNDTGNSAGGGGYYGGSAGITSTGTHIGPGSGGSGYIGNNSLLSYRNITKVMYCYHCSISEAESTYTENTSNYSQTPISYYAKAGSGFAKLTLLAQPSENNYLSTITTDKGELSPKFDMTVTDYTIDLTPEEDTITIDAIVEDDTATVSGTGEFEVPAGVTEFPITVVAESGDIRIYTITVKREKSSNPYPNNIKMAGLIPSLCSVKDEYCKLDQDFHPDTASYHMTVPSRQKTIEFVVEKGHKYQTVTGDGEVELESGMNTVIIEVTSEDGEHIATYTYYINRDMSGDNNIENLEVIDPATNIDFTPEVAEYYFSIPNSYTSVELKIVLEDPKATYKVIGNENFVTGLNIVEILVTAQNKDQKTYTLNIYREQSGNVFLKNLEVSNDTEIFDLNPTFNKVISTYTVNVVNEVEEVEIKATPEHPLTVVTGAGQKKLKIGTNTFQITSTAEDGSIQIYEVAIVRAKNSDATLKILSALEGTLSPNFQSANMEYSIEVNPGVTSLNLNVEPTASTSKYAITGNYGFKVGVDNVVSIVVTAEDGTKNTYQIHVTRKASSNANLISLNTNKYDMTNVFNKEIDEYHITVENEVESIRVDAIAEDKLARVTGAGTYSLKAGNNDIDINVEAEDGTLKTYTLHIFRKYNSNTNLISLTTDSSSTFNEPFHKDTTNYTLIVENEIEKITILGVAEEQTSKVIGNGNYALTSGDNEITIKVEAEDGSTKEYTLIVSRKPSSNANLSMIIAKESVLDPSFDKNKTDYVLKVIESVTSLNLLITKEESHATYEVIGNENFEIGNNTVTIRVTAEDGVTTKDYVLDVLRQAAGTTSNRLDSLTVDNGSLKPIFDKDTNYYEVEVPYEVTDITLSGELEDKNATVTGFGTYSLNLGVNVLSVQVTSVENVVRYYQVVVTRLENEEARLASLQVLDSNLIPNFNKDTYQYSLSTTLTELNIKALPIDSKATVEIIGNENLKLGFNQVIIRVTAADKVTTKDYILEVEKEKSSNNNLKSLEVENHTFLPEFSKTTTVYNLEVDRDTEKIQIAAVPEDINATVEGIGERAVSIGVNYLEITVTSENGNKKAYTIIVTRKGNNNNYLKTLEVSSGNLSPEFVKTENNYTVTVPYEVEEITLSGLAEDSNAMVDGFGTYSLNVGENTYSIIVTAEDGTTNVYFAKIIREKLVSSQLKELSVKGYQLNQTFNPDVYDYNVVIDSEITALDLAVIPLDTDATYQIIGNENFVVGMNRIEILVTDSLGGETSTYTLNVNRQNYANTYLAYIYSSEGVLSPVFHKTTLEYTVFVDSSIDSIDIMADVEVDSNTLTGTGAYSLAPGDNKIALIVTTPSGISRIYYVNVIKALKNDNDLRSLEVMANGNLQTLNPEFDKDELNYTVTIEAGTPNIKISATAEESATISGIGNKMIHIGENDFEIVVTAEDGSTKTYSLKVNREASGNNHLIDIIPSAGTLNPSFSYTRDEYSLVLDMGASLLSFEVTTEDRYATVTGNEIQVIPDGLSKREIVVEAEDGSKKVYTINVYKERNDEARLESLQVDGYTFHETFDKDTFHYTLTVPNEKNVLLSSEVEALPLDSSATVTKTTSLVLSSSATNIYTIIVTAKDGFTKQTYTIEIDREKGNDSTLSKLEFVFGNLTEIFIPTKTEYTLSIPKNITQIKKSDVTAIPSDSDATVMIPDIFIFDSDHTIYEIVVESADKSSTTTYTINIEASESSSALLRDLSVDHGILSPDFDKNHNNYTLELDSEVEELMISATAEDENAVIIGDGKQNVVTGLNHYEVVVTTEDGTVNTYVIEATRGKSSNTNILDIIPSSGSLSPSYSNEVDTYEVEVGEEVDTIDFEVQLESKRATVSGDKGNSLNYGENDITITVEAEDGTTKEVSIKVIREKKITDIEVPEEILMDVGDIEVVDVEITPEDATYKELVWQSSDTDIVTVVGGTLEAKALGETTITVSSARDSTIQKEIKVRVLNLKISSDIYEVRRNVLFLDDDSKIQHMIIGAEALEDLDTFISKLKNEKDLIKIYTIDNVEMTDTSGTTVTTGQIIKLEYKGKIYDSVYMVVRGEVTKDLVIDNDDYNELVKQLLKKQIYSHDSLEFKASDVIETEEVDIDDSQKTSRFILKKDTTMNEK